MVIIQSPIAIILFSASLILAFCCNRINRCSVLPFVGSILTSIGIIISLIQGASMQEILIVVLFILAMSTLGNNRMEDENNEF